MRVLIVDDEANFREVLVNELPEEWTLHLAGSLLEARRLLESETIDVVLLDLRLPDGSGLELLPAIRGTPLPPEVIVLTGYGDVSRAVEAMRMGVDDFATKPIGLEKLESLIRAAGERRGISSSTAEDTASLIEELPPNLRALGRQAILLAKTDIPILIVGESGVGKEHFAQFIRQHSLRADNAFLALNCAAIPEHLIESELFGFERGAFTGAMQAKDGFFGAADGGTLFLDEIGELSLQAQAKLLRALDTGEFYRVGSLKPSKVNVRFLSATNRDLRECIAAETFREDFFFRINGFKVRLPPLRDRPDDVLYLSNAILREAGKRASPAAMLQLQDYEWPGNVRELNLVLQRAIAIAGELPMIPDATISMALSPNLLGEHQDIEASLSLESMTRRHIRKVLKIAGGNQAQAAKLLGIDPKTLYRRLKEMETDELSKKSTPPE